MSGIVNKVKEVLHGDSHKHDNNVPEGTYGPHSTRTANAADPRVDSDRDNTARHAGATRTAGHGEYGSGHGFAATEGSEARGSGMAGSGYETRVGTGVGTGRADTTTGAYESGMHAPGHHVAGSGVTGVTGTHGAPGGTFGPHSSGVANVADPRVDSDRDGRAAVGSGGPGPAPYTAGPHKNDTLNKVDPRVDSDMDGSRTVGGNKTYH